MSLEASRRPVVLSRDTIVAAALAVIDRLGADGLTMDRTARELGIGTMTLYGYVRDKGDLLDAVIDAALADISVPSGDDGDWIGRLTKHMRELRVHLRRHPGLGVVLLARAGSSDHMLACLEDAVRILQSAGFGAAESVRAYHALLTYTLGFISWESPRTGRDGEQRDGEYWRETLDRLPRSRFTALPGLADSLVGVASDEQYEYGLAAIVAGLRRRFL